MGKLFWYLVLANVFIAFIPTHYALDVRVRDTYYALSHVSVFLSMAMVCFVLISITYLLKKAKIHISKLAQILHIASFIAFNSYLAIFFFSNGIANEPHRYYSFAPRLDLFAYLHSEGFLAFTLLFFILSQVIFFIEMMGRILGKYKAILFPSKP